MNLAESLHPGEYLALITEDANLAIFARLCGLSLRDTLLVLGPGKHTRFCFLYRKPTNGTVLDSILQHDTGLLNIDACCIAGDLSEFYSATGKPRSGLGHAKGFGMGDGYGGDKANPPHIGGRWPTNVALIHCSDCRQVGTRKVTTGVAHRSKSGGKTFGGTLEKPPMQDMTYAGPDGKESIPSYECNESCAIHLLDHQSGDRVSTLTGRANPMASHAHPSSANTESWFSGGKADESRVYADSGGASRFYPQFKEFRFFLEWVHQLIGEPNVVLPP